MFQTILGNDHIKKYLQLALKKNSVANTVLFVGPDGIGKKLFAKELAFYLMYSNVIDDVTKKRVIENKHPDLHIYRPEGKSGMHPIAAMRELITQVFLSPFEAESKVFIIYDAERMLPSSANALLKTLEEPNLDSYIILLTTKESLLLPTIVSRCVRLQFHPLSEKQVAGYISEKWKKTPTEAQHIASLAYGSIGKAEDICAHPDYHSKKKLLLSILGESFSWSYVELSHALEKLDKLFTKEPPKEAPEESLSVKWRKEVEFLLTQIAMWYRDLHLLKQKGDRRHLFFAEHLSLLQAQDASRIAPLEKILEWIDEAKLGIDRNMKLITCLEVLFFKLGIV